MLLFYIELAERDQVLFRYQRNQPIAYDSSTCYEYIHAIAPVSLSKERQGKMSMYKGAKSTGKA